VEVTTSWEGHEETTSWGTCDVPSSLAAGATSGGTDYTCPDPIKIPEIELYYSSVHFTITSAQNSCKVMSFRPYFYVKSTAAAYNTGAAVVDCSGAVAAPPIDCYGGAGTLIIPSFPTNGGIYFLTVEGTLTATYDVISANLQRQVSAAFSGWITVGYRMMPARPRVPPELLANS